MSPLSGDAALTASCLQQFHQAQDLRCSTYKQLAEGFDDMLKSRQEGPYRDLLAQATVAFQVCSKSVNTAEASLREMCCLDLADMLRVLQLNEKEKLKLTLILQALKQSYNRGTFSWQESSAEQVSEMHSAADQAAHQCHCCTSAEPTQEEFAAAQAEALQGLQSATENINDILEELRYAEAEYNEHEQA